jgi:hypothetical protein
VFSDGSPPVIFFAFVSLIPLFVLYYIFVMNFSKLNWLALYHYIYQLIIKNQTNKQTLTSLTQPPFYTCPNPGPGFPSANIAFFCVQ